jgi:hypothetical protein
MSAAKQNVNVCKHFLKTTLRFDLKMTSCGRDDEDKVQTFSGLGVGDTLSIASNAAHEELANKLMPEMDRRKAARKAVRNAAEDGKADDGKADDGRNHFHPDWTPSLLLLLSGHQPFHMIKGENLQTFVSSHLVHATASTEQNYCIGMDTEGRGQTQKRPYEHAKYMQIAAGNEVVVFRANADNCQVVLPLFLHKNIIISVVGKKGECKVLRELFDTEEDWSKGIQDLQDLAGACMREESPSLATIVNHLFVPAGKPKLMKFKEDSTQADKQKAYEPFEDESRESLPAYLLVYAALDAVAAKVAFEILQVSSRVKE